jgi:hypothetical protein
MITTTLRDTDLRALLTLLEDAGRDDPGEVVPWALLDGLARLIDAVSDQTRRPPLLCRLNLHHKWRSQLNPEGQQYLQCARCGKDQYDVERHDGPNTAGNIMGGGGT